MKRRFTNVWFLECCVWPSYDGRKLLHVPVGSNKTGWYIFWKMICDFLSSLESSSINFQHFIENVDKASLILKEPSTSDADVVRNNGSNSNFVKDKPRVI